MRSREGATFDSFPSASRFRLQMRAFGFPPPHPFSPGFKGRLQMQLSMAHFQHRRGGSVFVSCKSQHWYEEEEEEEEEMSIPIIHHTSHTC